MEFIVIFILVLLNGFFALSEIALVSVKKSHIHLLVSQGNKRAKTVQKILKSPENFLSSVQVGITLIGIVAGAYGGATLVDDVARYVSEVPLFQTHAYLLSLVFVIGGITYFTIIFGELVPKVVAMNNAEAVALICIPIIKYFTFATYPFVKLLSWSTKGITSLFGVQQGGEEKVSEDELRFLLKNASRQGVLESEEGQVHQNLFSFTDQNAQSLMTHRSELEWIDKREDITVIFHKLKESPHSKFIVGDGSLDKIRGTISLKDFWENYNRDHFQLDDILRKPIVIPQSTPAFRILNLFKLNKDYVGIVVDEFGSVKGMVTIHDLFEALIGELPDEDDKDEPSIRKRNDGTYLLDGKTLIYELNQYFQREMIPDNIAQYTTVAGFFLHKQKHIPKGGDVIRSGNLTLEIVDMDGVRIDKILMSEGKGL